MRCATVGFSGLIESATLRSVSDALCKLSVVMVTSPSSDATRNGLPDPGNMASAADSERRRQLQRRKHRSGDRADQHRPGAADEGADIGPPGQNARTPTFGGR